MMQDRELFERAARRFEPAPSGPAWEGLLRRRDHKRRNQRLLAATVALLLTALAVGGVIRAFGVSEIPRPAAPTIAPSSVSSLHLVGTGTFDGQARSVAVADGLVYVQNKGAHQLAAFPADCATSGSTCSPAWVADIGATPVIPEFGTWAADGVVYVASDRLYAFAAGCATDGSTCKPLWTGKVGGRPFEPAVGAGAVYVPSSDARLYRFPTSCARSGGTCSPDWVSAKEAARMFHPQVVGSTIIAQEFSPASYVAFAGNCGAGSHCVPEGRWLAPRGTVHAAIPTAANGSIYMGVTTGSSAGTLFAYPASCEKAQRTCAATWSASVPGEINAPPPLAADGKVFVGSTAAGFLKAFPATCAASTCAPLWTASVPNLDFTHPSVAGGVVFAGSRDGGVYAFPSDCGSGNAACRPSWSWGTGTGATATRIEAVTASGDHVYAISSDGHLYVFGLGASARRSVAPSSRPFVLYLAVVLVLVLALVATRRRNRSKT